MAQKVWTFRFSEECEELWCKLDPVIQMRVRCYLGKRLATSENPRIFAEPLTGEWKGLWRFRIGDYRLVCEIFDHELLILGVHVGHRSNVYKAAHRFRP